MGLSSQMQISYEIEIIRGNGLMWDQYAVYEEMLFLGFYIFYPGIVVKLYYIPIVHDGE